MTERSSSEEEREGEPTEATKNEFIITAYAVAKEFSDPSQRDLGMLLAAGNFPDRRSFTVDYVAMVNTLSVTVIELNGVTTTYAVDIGEKRFEIDRSTSPVDEPLASATESQLRRITDELKEALAMRGRTPDANDLNYLTLGMAKDEVETSRMILLPDNAMLKFRLGKKLDEYRQRIQRPRNDQDTNDALYKSLVLGCLLEDGIVTFDKVLAKAKALGLQQVSSLLIFDAMDIIRQYVENEGKGLVGGTGLPE